MERVFAEVERFDPEVAYVPRAIAEIGIALINHGEVEAYIQFIEENFGSAEDLMARHPISSGWGSAYLPLLAWAYREVGQEDVAQKIIDESAREIAAYGSDVEGNWVYSCSIARHAAITGDDEGALAALRRSVDNGLRQLTELDAPLYDHLHEDERFQAIRADLLETIDAERAKAGLPPYRPVDSTDERPTFVN
jgi:hypothetical protein